MVRTSDPLIHLQEVSKAYQTSSGSFHALRNVSMEIGAGQLVAVVGKSGSGKTTLLNMMAGIDTPASGSVMVNGTRIDNMAERVLAPWRGINIGIVFQFFQLLPTLTIAENVMLPMDFCHTFPKAARRKRALQLLDMVDIVAHADKLPSALSGGQQQRAAIARALANDPPVLIADEPTGNLDSVTSQSIFQLFTDLSKGDKTVVIVTHERELVRSFDAIFQINDGAVSTSGPDATLRTINS